MLVTMAIALALILASPSVPENQDCLACHGDRIDAVKFPASAHGVFSCTDCHSGAAEFPHAEGVKQVDCAACHADAVESYQKSIHGQGRARGITEAAACADCHGDTHAITPHTEEASAVHWSHLAQACARCHANPEMAAKYHFTVVRPVEAYRASVHARTVIEGRAGPTCSNCHGNHAIFPATDPRSKVFHQRVPDTCGVCHKEIAAAFKQSVHGVAVARGVRDAPVCTDCHGEHRILSPREPGSPVFPTNIPTQTCGHCHSDLRLSEKYGLSLDKVPAYEDSYHGLAARAGVQTVANCASCHGVHDIQPSSDPRSHVNPANLAQTCGQCHPGAGTRYALGPVHVVTTERQFAVVYYIRLAYLALIYLMIGGMLLHNLLDFLRKARAPAVRRLAGVTTEEERMNLGFRVAHGLVILSFTTLAYTGFALKYPDSWWAQPVAHWEAGLGRGWLHRIAAVVLLSALGFHLIHLARSTRARACIAAMRPSLEDWHELRERFRYYLGLRKDPPAGVKLGYIEKSEYLAFMWGTAIMALTGFLLWFENFTLRWFPKWMSDAATAVHFYEAILATLAILVWHFYWVIFDPAVYPMDASWWSGRAPLSRALERTHGHHAAAPAATQAAASQKQNGKEKEKS
ncbi:MAG TPA: cytochrome b/b6 domain-containing protein, partial [Candidatus Acidoferrales bacterium]|nr:cytochrome b/b6 domain-containing protein [Candidatus Acidoferrales bacterium]